jgi:FtsZ-binding cell division protein ZapB
MPDLRQQRDSARTERDQLRRENADLRAILGEIDPAYASAYRDLCDLAIHGLRRPDDLGGPIKAQHAQSKPPAHHAKAYHLRNEERRWQRLRADRIRHAVDRIDDPTPLPHASATTPGAVTYTLAP